MNARFPSREHSFPLAELGWWLNLNMIRDEHLRFEVYRGVVEMEEYFLNRSSEEMEERRLKAESEARLREAGMDG